jgi:hypothetical protein
MTCIAIVRDTANGVYIASDGVCYDDNGIVLGFDSKVVLIPDWNCVLGSTGAGQFGLAFRQQSALDIHSFDDLIKCVVKRAQAVHQRYVDHYGFDDRVTLVLAGWSDARQRFETYKLCSHEDNDYADPPVEQAPWSLISLPYIWSSVAPRPEDAPRFGLNWPNLDGGGVTHAIGMTARLVCAARARSGPLPAVDIKDTARAYACGGFLQLTTLTRDCITSEIIHRWPDRVGSTVDPSVGDPMPADLPEAISDTAGRGQI